MYSAISQPYARPADESKESRITEDRHIKPTPLPVLDAEDVADTAVTDIVSAWARCSTAANGFGY